ncbi:hypothetical protein HBB16_11970 [Pseudonocardia sp. MCCB 268]|nr:hypothetical protein [Pseudonocardia cytotoxica]
MHVVTTNDYLAKRDSETMGRIHHSSAERRRDPHRMTPAQRAASSTPGHTLARLTVRVRPARQHGVERRGHGPARAQRDRRRGRLDPHRRSPDTAPVISGPAGRAPALPGVRPAGPMLTKDITTGRRAQAHRPASPRRCRADPGPARHRQPLPGRRTRRWSAT